MSDTYEAVFTLRAIDDDPSAPAPPALLTLTATGSNPEQIRSLVAQAALTYRGRGGSSPAWAKVLNAFGEGLARGFQALSVVMDAESLRDEIDAEFEDDAPESRDPADEARA